MEKIFVNHIQRKKIKIKIFKIFKIFKVKIVIFLLKIEISLELRMIKKVNYIGMIEN